VARWRWAVAADFNSATLRIRSVSGGMGNGSSTNACFGVPVKGSQFIFTKAGRWHRAAMPPPGRAERTEQDAPPCLIAFRRLTLRPATGMPQRGGPYHPGANTYVGVWVQLNRVI